MGLAAVGVLAAPGPIKSALQVALGSTKQAQAALRKGDAASAVSALERALASARKEAPLVVRKVVVVKRPSRGLGVYEPLPEARLEFRTLWLYVEVANFATRPRADELEVKLSVDGEFFDGEGVSIGSRGLGTHSFVSRTAVGMTSFGLDVRLGESAPKGAYAVELTVKDELSAKTGKGRVRFTIP